MSLEHDATQCHGVLPPAYAQFGLLSMEISGVSRIGPELFGDPRRKSRKPRERAAQRRPGDRLVAGQLHDRLPAPVRCWANSQLTDPRRRQSFLAGAFHGLVQSGLMRLERIAALRPTQPHAIPLPVKRRSALSARRLSRNSAREVNIRYGSVTPWVTRSSTRTPM